MKFAPGRRRFLLSGAAVGGGLLIGYGLFRGRDLLGDRHVPPVSGDEVALNAWLKIASDGSVTVAVPRAEMGQGIYTALPMLVAEELDVAWADMRVVQAPIDQVYGNVVVFADSAPFDRQDHGFIADSVRWTLTRAGRALGIQITGGSSSVRDAWLPMRTAGAAARDMLLRAGATRLEVAVTELITRDGMVVHDSSGRAVSYGALAGDAAALAPAQDFRLREPDHWRHLGQPCPRLDVPAKVDGSAQFGIDVRQAGTVYVALRIAPVFGGRLASFDRAALEARPGVIAVVPMDDALAVAGRTWWHAEQALAHAAIEFDDGPHAALSSDAIFSAYARALDAADGYAYENRGDARAVLADGVVIRAEYRVPMLAHACMEPMNCTVRLRGGKAEIWIGNQAPDLLRRIAADALDLDTDQITVHTPYLGGGFGRRAEPDVMLRALTVARAIPDQTVQLIYSREQDLQHDTYRPSALSRFVARLGADGNILAWHHHIASPSVSQAVLGRAFPRLPLGGPDRTNVEGAAFLPYATAHRRVEHTAVPIVPTVGFWRSVGHSFNAFFSECFVDELAVLAGVDPIEFRLRHLGERPREAHVLALLRDLSDWTAPLAAGRARGVALHESFHSIVGQVAEVRLDQDRIVVERVICVIDCGQVVNPDSVFAQMESGIVFGLTAALYGDVKLADGRIRQSNFPDYRMLTLAEMPRIETHVVQSGAEPGGVGEPGTPPIAPAVANALARLTGVRQRALPLRADVMA